MASRDPMYIPTFLCNSEICYIIIVDLFCTVVHYYTGAYIAMVGY